MEKIRKMNKKGAELTIGTIVIIILALIVLVVIALGFTTGWRNLWEKITRLGGGGSTLETLSQACQIACAAPDVDAYCLMDKEYKNDSGISRKNTCHELAAVGKISACSDINVVSKCPKVYTLEEMNKECHLNMHCAGGPTVTGPEGAVAKNSYCNKKYSVAIDDQVDKLTCYALNDKIGCSGVCP